MEEKVLREHLYRYFKYDRFHEGQQEIINDILKGNDVLGVLRTGTGKSLCYQLPAKLLPGITIVVSPLISLMIDQVRETKAFHFKEVVALHSFQSRKERQTVLSHLHHYKLVYVSPELLQQKFVLQAFTTMHVSLFVIDEAHCISQWGYDFRPDYLRLTKVINELNNPPLLALTGTATPEVQQDIIDKLHRSEMRRHVYPMDRENISLVVHEVHNGEEEKLTILCNLLSKYRVPTIVYFSSRKLAEQVASKLTTKLLERKIAYYHGGMDAIDRLKVQQQFINDQLDIICCTSAFGMGMNKKNIRLVVHYHIPTQLESYIQEIGRAGRDGKESVALLLYRQTDFHIPLQIIENELPLATEITHVMNRLYQLYVNKRNIPLYDEELEQYFQINITKWRFLHYQFESHGMISNNKIYYDAEHWKKSIGQIKQFSDKRRQMKREKVAALMNWAHSKQCLRKKLYESFQQTVQKKEQQCCSNCGFLFKSWHLPLVKEADRFESANWKEQLASLLLVGENE